jgi:hypothetical protein
MTSRVAVAAAVAFAALACGPHGPVPGGRLTGEVVNAPVDDWSFAKGVETISIETRPGDPYSVNVWFVSHGPRLWVAAGGGAGSKWAKNLMADPRVRLLIDGKLYERKAVRTTDQAELDEALVLYQTKYDYQRDPKDEGKAVLFRMDPL